MPVISTRLCTAIAYEIVSIPVISTGHCLGGREHGTEEFIVDGSNEHSSGRTIQQVSTANCIAKAQEHRGCGTCCASIRSVSWYKRQFQALQTEVGVQYLT